MNTKYKSILLHTVLLLALLQITSCGSKTNYTEDKSKHIVVSILPQKYILQNLVDTSYMVSVLMPPGANHTNFEPSPNLLTELSQSDILFTLGLFGYEELWQEKFLSINQRLQIASTSDNFPKLITETLQGGKQFTDPHIWLSISGIRQICINMLEVLTEIYPEDKELFAKNFKIFDERLIAADSVIKKILADNTTESFIIFHPSLSYYANEYNLEQISIEKEGKEPTISYLNNIIETAKSKQLKNVLVSKQFDTKQAYVVAEQINGTVVEFNPMEENVVDNLVHITTLITKGAQ
ncbi:MAG: zinc ABC transporter substrate-binding protein [Lentimicrobiaceae bacterium]|nr:zinc ABC transporter substrate-binding protein [Lentimicrobiaceae bacterium]